MTCSARLPVYALLIAAFVPATKVGILNLQGLELFGLYLFGIVMGILNFFGFYAFLLALQSGPLSAIALITGMHFVIAIGLSVLFYKERLTLARSLGIALTLLSVFLLRQ